MMFRKQTWKKKLSAYSVGKAPLLTADLLKRHGERAWSPNADDRRAAALLHVQLTSRIATQELGYASGVEKAALESLRLLFERTRAITEEHLDGRHCEVLAWFVLNHHVRPFTARWHRRSESGKLDALDDADEFRLELAALRSVLVQFDNLLLELRDGTPPASFDADRIDAIGEELSRDLPWGLNVGDPDRLAGATGANVEDIATAERTAIRARRINYGFKSDAARATGLALSGGGIRSATFALGVLSALGRRGLLKQFDYLSTVSGGGYLGAFLVDYLAGAPAVTNPAGGPDRGRVGLRKGDQPFGPGDRDSPALGHIRQNCRYLASGPASERWTVALAQVAGLLNNLVALASVAALLALVIDLAGVLLAGWALPTSPVSAFMLLTAITGLVAALAILWVPVVASAIGSQAAGFDRALLWLVLPFAVVLLFWTLSTMRQTYAMTVGTSASVALAILLIPLLVLIAGVVLERVLPVGGLIASWVARAAAPLFSLAVFLTVAHLVSSLADQRGLLWLWVVAALLAFVAFLNLNFSGLHRHYRRKLAATFLIRPGAGPSEVVPSVGTLLSTLGANGLAPYPIINAALNVPASKQSAMRGRLTDFFSFTPDHCGSPITGYRPTTEWERKDRNLTLATAMAISGAAISPRMGVATRPQFGFWLSLLNVRLGYWLRDPAKRTRLPLPGLPYLVSELTGRIDEQSAFLNVSDGGHIENLGIYELLRRRCKLIVAVDGEQDPSMTFHGLANLQRLAAIDLGIRIDINLGDLRLDARGLSRSHFQFCRIHYSASEIGYLVYLKLSLTGNEGEFLRRFRLDEPDFPHHPTADQNFTEARFEAYRSLGQHVGEKLFLESIVGPMAREEEVDMDVWFAALGRSLLEPLRPAADARR